MRSARPSQREAEAQLALLEGEPAPWRLDPRTREVGRRGVAAAREVLRSSVKGGRSPDHASRAA